MIHKQNWRKLPKRERDYRRQCDHISRQYKRVQELTVEFKAWEMASDEALRLIEPDETMIVPARPLSEPLYIYPQTTAGSGLLMPRQDSSTAGDHNLNWPIA